MQRTTEDENGPIKRKVQITGGSTYTVSIPKPWADTRGIGSGSPLYIYPFDDRLIVAQPNGNGVDRRATIDVEAVGEESLRGQIGAAYAAGSDEIVVESDTRFSTSERRAASQAITDLVGVEITTETEQELIAKTLLDSAEVSLEGTIKQIRGIALSMHENAVKAVVNGDSETQIEHILSRDDEVDRLFALVSRQFYRILTDIREINQLKADRRTAFTQFRTARQLERIADHAERIATVADKQTEPPDAEIGAEFETLATDARRVVRIALGGNAGEAILRRDDVVERLDDLDRALYDSQNESVYLYGRVLESIRRTAEYGGNIAEVVTLSEMTERS
jgi:phosphate uptake regulator